MTEQTHGAWHEQDGFWQTFEPTIFDTERRALAPEEVDQIIELLALAPGQRICDLCCGVGRHSLELARRGFQVTAVDRTERYLDQARTASEAEDLPVEFTQDDMRDFCQPDTFDVILNLFTSFGYFETQRDEQRTLENAFRSLRQGGRFVLELMSKEIIARIFGARDWRPVEGGFLLEERKIVDAWSRIENTWTLIRDGKQQQWTFSHRLYSATELGGLLETCGFRDVTAYGSLTGAPYDEKAERLVIVAGKQAG